MFFADLPSEVLAQIIEYEDVSYYILNLWKCGNKILNAKLASGVTYVHLETEAYMKYRYPLMVSSLRNLRHVNIHSGHDLPVDYSNEIRKLPPTIESLHLNTYYVLDGFSDCSPGERSGRPNYTKRNYGRGETSFYDIAAYFPNLHTLELRKGTEGRIDALQVPDLAGLPSTITRLITDDIHLGPEQYKLASFLPKSLRRLESRIFVEVTYEGSENEVQPFLDDWSHAPPQLEHITKIRLPSMVKDVSWVPQSLTSVKIVNFNNAKFTPIVAAALPPSLEESLLIGTVDYEAFSRNSTKWSSALPTQLRKLTLDRIDSDESNDIEDVQFWRQLANLPRSLTTLKLKGYEMMRWDTLTPMLDQIHDLKWPSSLSTLSINCGIPLEVFHLLPPTLTSFGASMSLDHVEDGEEQITLDANVLPPKLALLRLNGYWGNAVIAIKNQLPLSLTDLCVRNETSHEYGVSRESFDRIKNLTLLKRLEIDIECPMGEDTDGLPALPLPPNLEVLKLPVWEARWFTSFPRTLTDLNIMLLNGVREAVTDGLKFFMDLPPHLVNFTAVNRDLFGIEFPENAFPHLPRLRLLDIYTIGKFPSSMLRVLSSTMKRILIDVAEIQETDAPFLPPLVHQLFLKNQSSALGNKTFDISEHWPIRAFSDCSSAQKGKVLARLYKVRTYG